MSLILNALKKAKDLSSRKAPPTAPAALASFGFRRRSRFNDARHVALLYLLPGALLVLVALVAAHFWLQPLKHSPAAAISAPPVAQPAAPPARAESAAPPSAAVVQPVPPVAVVHAA